MMNNDDVLRRIEEDRDRSARRVKAILWEQGRPDLANELDAKMRDIRLGIDGARSTWHSISPAQRRVLEVMSPSWPLNRIKPNRYGVADPSIAPKGICGLATIRALCARDLLAPDGGTFDPEGKFVLTERARFVMKHGRPAI